MIELSESARKELEAYFADKPKSPIRVYMTGGCGGPRLALALDEPTDQDQTETQGTFTFCMDKEIVQQVQGAKIDLTYMGFTVDPVVPFAPSENGAEGGCGGCCGCCGSGS